MRGSIACCAAKRRRTLVPVWCLSNTTGGLPGSSTVMLSADGGLTWPRQITVGDGEIGGSDFDESAAEVYPNGDVVMIIQAHHAHG